jgi:hypothetical protein
MRHFMATRDSLKLNYQSGDSLREPSLQPPVLQVLLLFLPQQAHDALFSLLDP